MKGHYRLFICCEQRREGAVMRNVYASEMPLRIMYMLDSWYLPFLAWLGQWPVASGEKIESFTDVQFSTA
jgi:hypothetical protein